MGFTKVNGRPRRMYDDPIPGGSFRWDGVDRVDIGGRLTDERPTGGVMGRPKIPKRGLGLKVPPLIMPGMHGPAIPGNTWAMDGGSPPPSRPARGVITRHYPEPEFVGRREPQEGDRINLGNIGDLGVGMDPEPANPNMGRAGKARVFKRRRFDSSGMP